MARRGKNGSGHESATVRTEVGPPDHGILPRKGQTRVGAGGHGRGGSGYDFSHVAASDSSQGETSPVQGKSVRALVKRRWRTDDAPTPYPTQNEYIEVGVLGMLERTMKTTMYGARDVPPIWGVSVKEQMAGAEFDFCELRH